MKPRRRRVFHPLGKKGGEFLGFVDGWRTCSRLSCYRPMTEESWRRDVVGPLLVLAWWLTLAGDDGAWLFWLLLLLPLLLPPPALPASHAINQPNTRASVNVKKAFARHVAPRRVRYPTVPLTGSIRTSVVRRFVVLCGRKAHGVPLRPT